MTTFELLLQTFAEWRERDAAQPPGYSAADLDVLLHHLRTVGSDTVLFDPAWFLARHGLATPSRTVAKVTLNNYLKTGVANQLDPTPWFSESVYRALYPDVRLGIEAGQWRCGFQHYLLRGIPDRRSPSPAFNELAYLGRHKDILTAVENRSLPNGFMHYLITGKGEGRSADPDSPAPLLTLPIRSSRTILPSAAFAEELYRAINPDLDQLVGPTAGMLHWQNSGVLEDLEGRRARMDGWVENIYLRHNPDLGPFIGTAGNQPSGYSHFLMHGAAEQRRWAGADWERLEPLHLQDALRRRTELPEPPEGAEWPVISVIVPVFNPDAGALQACIDSVLAQTYPHWQLCLADDASTLPHVAETLVLARQADARVHLVFGQSNGGISAASNAALAAGDGEFVALLDHDDILAPDALLHLALAFTGAPEVDMVYTDEAKLTEDGTPVGLNAKPGWSPELLLSTMYTGHLTGYRRSVVDQVGRFRSTFDGTQDYDLALRVAEVARGVVHVPLPLYFWRMSPASTAGALGAKPSALRLQGRALESAMVRRGKTGTVSPGHLPGHWAVRLGVPDSQPLVSIVIPTAGRGAVLDDSEVDLVANTIHSLDASETYPNYEIVVVHNKSLRAETLLQLANYPRLRLVRFPDGPFSYSGMVNRGVEEAAGEFVLLLNDDMQAESGEIIQAMLARMFDGVGIVGGRLLFTNGTLQHAGIMWGQDGPTHTMIGEHRLIPGPAQRLNVTHDVFAVTGACMFFRRAVFLDCGGLSPELPVNYNDVDFCLRMRDRGLRVVFNPDVTMFHFESLSKSGTYFWELQRLLLDHPALSDPYLNPTFDSANPFFQLRDPAAAASQDYRTWLIARLDRRRTTRASSQEKKFSFILSVYETPLRFLIELESTLLRQTYRNWELALVDNGCREPEVVAWLDRMREHPQVTFVRLPENQGIMGGYGTAFRAATGDYVVPVDSDDLLTLDCLDVLAFHLEAQDWPDAVYSDEDKADSRSHMHSPFLKPDWDPVLFTNICFVAHVCAIRRELAVSVSAYSDDAAAGCHDWDTFLRVLRAGGRIVHVPELLYTWRIHAGSTASIETGNKPYTITSQKHVLDQHLRLTGLDAAFTVVQNELFPHNGIWRLLPTRRELPAMTLVVVASADRDRTAQFLGDLALSPRPAACRIVVVGGDPADLSPTRILSEVSGALWPDGKVGHSPTLAGAVAEATGQGDGHVVGVVHADVGALNRDWLLEGAGLFRFGPDVAAVGGTVATGDGTVVWRGGFGGFGGGAAAPDFGKAITDSGYHGIGWCQRTVDAVPSVCFFARATLLHAAVQAAGPGAGIRSVTGALALAARRDGLRTIQTPFVQVTLDRLVSVSPILPLGEESVFEERPHYYAADFGQTLATAYQLAPAA